MVWDALARTSFADGSVLRSLAINNLIEATYYLAPNYWTVAGDLAVGDVGRNFSERGLQTLSAPTSNDLLLVHNGPDRLPSWRGVNDVLLTTDDYSTEFIGDTFQVSTILIARPHRRYRARYRRTSTGWEAVSGLTGSNIDYRSPLVQINNRGSQLSKLQVVHDTGNRRIRVFCIQDIRLTMVVNFLSDEITNYDLNDVFLGSGVFNFGSGTDHLIDFDISSTGPASPTNPGFELLDTNSFYRDSFSGDIRHAIFVSLFYLF